MIDYTERAQEIQRRYDEAAGRVRADRDLSPEGKISRIAELDAQRRDAVAELKRDAAASVERERAKIAGEVERLRTEHFNGRRELLGDAVIVKLYESQISASPNDVILQLYDEASAGFEKELVRNLALVKLAVREAAGEYTPDDMRLAVALDDTPPGLKAAELRLRELDHTNLDDLDLSRWRDRTAAAFGLSPASVAAAAWGGE